MTRRHLLRTTNPLRRRISKPTKPGAGRWYHEVSYPRYGKDPSDVLSYRSDPAIGDLDPPFSALGNNDGDGLVRVEMIHAPWNPADVNTVQGRYPSPYEGSSSHAVSTTASDRKGMRVASDRCIGLHFDEDPVIGSEGWGRVTHSESPAIPPGTLVTMGLAGLGTLRSSLWVPESSVLRVPESVWERLGPSGCSLFQLGGTALRLLSDFVPPGPGDVVLQNAGNSGVGFLASQLAASSRLFGSNSHQNVNNRKSAPVMVSLIRRRGRSKESFDEAVEYLKREGKNALVLAEEDFFLADDTGNTSRNKGRRKGSGFDETAVREMRQRLRDLSPNGSLPKLALNAVGGKSAQLLLKLLEPHVGSTIVTYGGMSGKGIRVATPQLIFNDVRAVGYWHSRWMVRQHEREQQQQTAIGETTTRNRRAEMVNLLSKLVEEEHLKCPPAHIVRLENLQDGLLWQSEQSDDQSSDSFPIRKKMVWDCREYC